MPGKSPKPGRSGDCPVREKELEEEPFNPTEPSQGSYVHVETATCGDKYGSELEESVER